MKKNTWSTPELIVFVKAEPEDSILTHCKSSKNTNDQLGSGAGNHCQAITYKDDGITPKSCAACQSNGGGIS